MRVIRRNLSIAERLRAVEDPGKPRRQLAGTYVSDLSALKKAIQLCGLCLRKWHSANAGYVTKRNLPFVRGRCDGCGEHHDRMRLFVHHTQATGL